MTGYCEGMNMGIHEVRETTSYNVPESASEQVQHIRESYAVVPSQEKVHDRMKNGTHP